jgi:hypothetical protein
MGRKKMKKLIFILLGLAVSGCSALNKDYQTYAEHTSKIISATTASEAACMLVLAEGVKSGDNSTKTAISTQIEKCKKDTPKIEPPKRNWLGL